MIGKEHKRRHYVHVHIEMTGDPLKTDWRFMRIVGGWCSGHVDIWERTSLEMQINTSEMRGK